MNIQNLLTTNPVQPNVGPVAIQPDYKQGSFVGGKLQLGETSQQVGPSSEVAMYGALAEIASGGAKAINTFADISSRIDKEKIQKAETYFNELNTRNDLTPDQKQQEFDKYSKEIWTPILGDTWRRQMAVEVDKNWTSKTARNNYEAARYESTYNNWKRKPENSGRPETNELLQEFNSFYALEYPSSKYNDWYTQVATKVDSAIALKNAEQAVIDFRGSVEISYQVPSREELNAYYNSANLENNARFEEMYKTFFELKKAVDSTSDFGAMNAFVYKHMTESLGPRIEKLTPEAARMVASELDQLAQAKTKELFKIVQVENITQLKTQAALNLGSNENNFGITRNVGSYLDVFTQNIGQLSAIDRRAQVDNIIPFIWKTLSSGTSQESIDFRSKPLSLQLFAVEDAFRTWYNGTELEFAAISGIDKDSLDNFIERGKFAVLNDENLGGKVVSLNFGSLKENASQTLSIFPLQSATQIQKSMEAYRQKTANALGIGVESVQELAYILDSKNVPSFTSEPLVLNWFKSLSPQEQQKLDERGFTADNFAKLEDFRSTYVDLEAKARIAISKVDSPLASDTTGPIDKMSNAEVQAKLLVDPSIRGIGFASRSKQSTETDESGLGINEEMGLTRVSIIMSDMETRFRAFVQGRREIDTKAGKSRIPGNLELFKNSDGSMVVESLSPQSLIGKIEVDETGTLTEAGVQAALRLEFAAMEMTRIEPSNSSENAFKTEVKTLLTQIGKSGFSNVVARDPQKVYALTAMLAGLAQGDPNFINAQTFAGTDSGQLTAMASLLKVAHGLSGGILDLSPEDFADPNVKLGYRRTQDGGLRPLSQEEKNKYAQHPMTRAVNSWRVAMDVFGTPMATSGEGTMNPLISNGKFDKPVAIRDEVSSVVQAFTTAGPNSYRDNGSLTALINRFNFPGAKSDQERISAFGQALHLISGQVSPALGSTEDTEVLVPGDDKMIFKKWSALTSEERIGVYLADLARIDPDATEMFLTGWLRTAANPATQDVYNLDMFVGTADFIREDLLKPRVSPLGTVQPRQYQTRVFENGPENTKLNVRVVNDGKNVSRRALFTQALGLSLSNYKVNTENVEHAWTSPGRFEDRYIPVGDGTYTPQTQNVRIGEVTSEDQFVITSQLATTMETNRDSYEYYKWWCSVIKEDPVPQEQFNNAINNLTETNVTSSPSTRLGLSGMRQLKVGDNPETTVRPPLFSVIAALHEVDLTSSNVEIMVDHKGDMYYNIGKERYLVPSNPLISPKLQYSNNNDAENERALFLYNREKLESSRADKRAAFKLKLPEPIYTKSEEKVVPHVNTVITVLDKRIQDYWKDYSKAENPYQWMLDNPFPKYLERKHAEENPGFTKLHRNLRSTTDAILGFISNGFRTDSAVEEAQMRRYMDRFERIMYRAFPPEKEKPKAKPIPKPKFGSVREFMEWLTGADTTTLREQAKARQRFLETSDSYLINKKRSGWKPALEDPNSLQREQYSTSEDWQKARQALRERNERAEREGY